MKTVTWRTSSYLIILRIFVDSERIITRGGKNNFLNERVGWDENKPAR